jgi:hypothetical protein
MLTEKEQQALEQLELERERRINEKLEKGAAVLKPPTVLGGPQDGPRAIEKDDEGREIYRGHRTDEGAVEFLDVIITGVPRAGRDPDVASATSSISPTKTAGREPEGIALRAHTTLGERVVSVKLPSRPQPPSEPAGAQRHPIKAEVSPTSERDTGFVFHGEFSIEAGQLRVYNMRGSLLGSSPIASGDDPRPLARRILRQKSVGGTGDFWAPLPARRDSFH